MLLLQLNGLIVTLTRVERESDQVFYIANNIIHIHQRTVHALHVHIRALCLATLNTRRLIRPTNEWMINVSQCLLKCPSMWCYNITSTISNVSSDLKVTEYVRYGSKADIWLYWDSLYWISKVSACWIREGAWRARSYAPKCAPKIILIWWI